MIDWKTAERIAGMVSGSSESGGRACPATSRRSPSRLGRAGRRLHADGPDPTAPPARGRLPGRVDHRQPPDDEADPRPPERQARRGDGPARSARPARRRTRPRRPGRRADRLPVPARARPVRPRPARPDGHPPPPLRRPEPQPRRRQARRRPGGAAALGRLPRGHPRRPVQVGQLAARAPRRPAQGAARRPDRQGRQARACSTLPGRSRRPRAGRRDPQAATSSASSSARDRKATIDRLQATMAVVEGHAEHVMDAVGADVLPSQAASPRGARAPPGDPLADLPPARAAARTRAEDAPVPRRQALLRQGRRARRAARAQPRLVGPDALPTLAELADPAGWIARTHVPIAAA